MIPYGVSTLFYGLLSDRLGRRRILLASLFAFITLTALTATAGTASQLIAWRLLTGLGASGVVSLALALMGDLFPYEQRGRPLGWLFGAMAGGAAFGATLGVILQAFVGWRMLFVGVGAAAACVWALLLPYGSCFMPHPQGRCCRSARSSEVIAARWPQDAASAHMGTGSGTGSFMEASSRGWASILPGDTVSGMSASVWRCWGTAFRVPAEPDHRKGGGLAGATVAGAGRACNRVAVSGCSDSKDPPVDGPFGRGDVVARLRHDATAIRGDRDRPRQKAGGPGDGANVSFLFIGFGIGSLLFGEALRLGLDPALAIFSSIQLLAAGLAIPLFHSETPSRSAVAAE